MFSLPHFRLKRKFAIIQTMQSHQRFLIVGYYGFDNAGDELLLQKSYALIHDLCPSPDISVLYRIHSPHALPAFNARYVNRWSLGAIFKSIWRTDWVVFGGGGLFQDHTSAKSMVYYLAILGVSVAFNRKILLLGQGISKFKYSFFRFIFAWLIRRVSLITVRDIASYQLIQDMAFPISKLHQTGDLAFYQAQALHPSFNIHLPVGVSFRNYAIPNENLIVLKSFFNKIQSAHAICFIDMQKISDQSDFYDFMQADSCEWTTVDGASAMLTGYPLPNLSLVVGMRYHALLLAGLNGIPFLGLVYDEKVKSLCIELSQPFVDLRIPGVTLAELVNAYNHLLKQAKSYQSRLQETVSRVIADTTTQLKEIHFD